MWSIIRMSCWLAGLLTLCVSFAATGPEPAQHRLTVAADVWCPYNCQPGSERPGYLVDILREVFSPLGVSVEYTVMPWKRTLASVERGLVDAALGAVGGNHGRNLIGRQQLGVDETVLVVRDGEEFIYQGPASLDELSIGVIADYTYDSHGPLDAYLNARIDQSRDAYVIHQDKPLHSLFAMLWQSRIDVFLENRYVARYAIESLGYQDQVAVIPTGTGDKVYIAFTPSPEGRRNVEILDAGVRRLRESGKLSEILGRYGLEDSP